MSFRPFVVVFYLVAVNLTAGLLAVEYHYPSLWGNSEVFFEYAVPLPFNWALVHIVPITPLAFVTWRAWQWTARELMWLRAALLAGLIGCGLLEFGYGGGRWHRIPFVLFPIVDLCWAFALSLLLTPIARRIAAITLVSGIVLFLYWPAIDRILDTRATRQAFERIASEDGSIRAVAVTRDGDATHYLVEVSARGKGRLSKTRCIGVLRVYERMLEIYEPVDDTEPIVLLSRPNGSMPFAQAKYSSRGRWNCGFSPPTPAAPE